MDNAIGPYWDCDCFTDGEDEDKRRVVRASAYDAAEVRIRELEEKLRLTEGAFKNTRIRELERLIHLACNHFENITVATTLEIAHDQAHRGVSLTMNREGEHGD